ncbi:MAG: response regulator [Myxococcales bacterium]
MVTTVALVDDHKLFREGLRALLQAHAGFSVVAEATNANEAYQAVRDTEPDVVVLDMLLPGSGGVVVARELLRQNPLRKVMALSMVKDEQHVASALEAGVLGYASKEQSAEDVLAAIRAVAQRQTYLAPGISRAVVEDVRHESRPRSLPAADLSPLATLTQREREVFDLTVSGIPTAGIARQLFISKRTVETHRARILRKLNAHSATDLVRLAAKLGLLSL